MALSPQARRLAGELADAIEAGDPARVVALVDGCGLTRNDRLGICRELDHPLRDEAATLRFDRYDRAYVEAA